MFQLSLFQVTENESATTYVILDSYVINWNKQLVNCNKMEEFIQFQLGPLSVSKFDNQKCNIYKTTKFFSSILINHLHMY